MTNRLKAETEAKYELLQLKEREQQEFKRANKMRQQM